MSEVKESRRVKMTKMLLKESLVCLMKEKSIHTISIKEICDGADINRSTFYRHYNTQYELYDDIVQDLVNNISDIFEQVKDEGYKANLFLTRLLEYIEAERELFLIVLSDKGNISVGEAYTKMISGFIDTETFPEIAVYVVNFIAAGMTSFLWTWLNQEKRRPAAEVATLMSSLMRHGLGRGIDFHPDRN
ncbi:MAG: TetR/AcrR family transcriptional regulator [Ruminococcaceae bacterium]|nr:TetR/AcrR family transcriptional regulator [Oscillospiraceae bacterium]MBQ9913324.1 TetR/AcrR family transcriptional regulator [Clostridia bacterium]